MLIHEECSACRPCPALRGLVLHDATAVFMCLRLLPPRTWWRLRVLSPVWRQLLEGSDDPDGARIRPSEGLPGSLLRVLVEDLGPLRSAGHEVDFAGCVYTAVHHGSAGPLQQLLRPLAVPGWSRRSFALAVAREALVQAAVAGDAASCQAVLSSHGPGSTADNCRRSLSWADATTALEAAAEWDAVSPEDAAPTAQRSAVREVLHSSCFEGNGGSCRLECAPVDAPRPEGYSERLVS